MKKLVTCVAICIAGGAWAVSCDGTNVWIGAASGGSWSNAANWEAHSAKGYGVEELFHRYTVYDFRNLAPGAVVTMDYEDGNAYNPRDSTGNTFVYGMVFSGNPGDTWTLAKGTDKRIRFTSPSYMDITGGTLDFQAAIVTSASYPKTDAGFHKRGTGTLRWGYPNAYFWESSPRLDAGTLELTNNASFTCCAWKMASGTKMNVVSGLNRLGSLFTDSNVSADTVVDIPAGTTLKLVTSFNTYSPNFYGDMTGSGTLDVRGGGSFVFNKGAKTGPFSFAGLLSAWNADLTFGTASAPVGVNPAASVDIAASGHINFTADQTLAHLSGKGADGCVVVPSNATLTVSGATGVSTSTVFAARIQGGRFVKDGADYELTLAGANAYTGATHVAGGTLTLDKGFARPNLCAAWRFEDENDLGAESTWGRALRLTPDETSPLSEVARLVDDGVSGRALRFLSGSTDALRKKGVVFSYVVGARDCSMPAGNDPFTVSFWLRPDRSGMPNGRHAQRDGRRELPPHLERKLVRRRRRELPREVRLPLPLHVHGQRLDLHGPHHVEPGGAGGLRFVRLSGRRQVAPRGGNLHEPDVPAVRGRHLACTRGPRPEHEPARQHPGSPRQLFDNRCEPQVRRRHRRDPGVQGRVDGRRGGGGIPRAQAAGGLHATRADRALDVRRGDDRR